jgi:HEAT repeat protein
MAVGKRPMLAARAVMQRDPVRYDAFLDGLLDGLSSENARTRFECAHFLDIFGTARCQEPLERLMEDPVPRVRWMAMHALSCHFCGEDTCNSAPQIRQRIAAAALGDDSVVVRRQATISLGLMKAPEAGETLRKIIAEETDDSVVRAAKWALPKCAARA